MVVSGICNLQDWIICLWLFNKALVPIQKSGNEKLLEKSRPISKLCIKAKLFASPIYRYTTLYTCMYSEAKNIINVEQHEFMRERSVKTNLFLYTNFLLEQMNSGFQVDTTFTNFSKAFAKFDHSISIRRLVEVGVYMIVC